MDRALIVVLICLGVGTCILALRLRRHRVIARVDPSDFAQGSGRGRGVVLFTSPYCLPCQLWAQELAGVGITFAQVDVASKPALASRYKVTSTPLVLAFDRSDGSVVWSSTDDPTAERVGELRSCVSGAGALGRDQHGVGHKSLERV